MNDHTTRIAVTTFNQSGFLQYGRRMIDTFIEFWPEDVRLIVVSEDPLDLHSDDRVIFHDYSALVPEGDQFKEKFAHFSQAHGIMNAFEMKDARKYLERPSREDNEKIEMFTAPSGHQVLPALIPAYYDFRYDAIRFSHKVFSIYGASNNYNVDHLFWIDGDTYTHKKIDQKFFEETAPGKSHLSYLGRDFEYHKYSECGFLIFNRRHPIHDVFLSRMIEEYLNGELFRLPEWHDSFVWDVHRLHYENTQGVTNRNISGKASGQEHPFINCILGDYMDHLKGNARKEAGKSFESDRMVD